MFAPAYLRRFVSSTKNFIVYALFLQDIKNAIIKSGLMKL